MNELNDHLLGTFSGSLGWAESVSALKTHSFGRGNDGDLDNTQLQGRGSVTTPGVLTVPVTSH